MVKRNGSEEALELDKSSKALLEILGSKEMMMEELIDIAMKRLNLKKHEVARAIYRLREASLIAMIDPYPPKGPIRFLLSSRSTWFWLLALAIVLTNSAIYILPKYPPFIYARYLLGSLFVLYLPGASLIELLYPKKEDLSQLERLALSIGLSLALVPLVGLILNYTPWGIRLDPIATSLTLLTLSLALAAVYRKYSYYLLASLKP